MKSGPPSPRGPYGLRALLSALSVAALVALAGCGQDGGAPASPASDTGSQFVHVAGSGRLPADLDPLAKKPGSGGSTSRTTNDAGGSAPIPGLTEPIENSDIVVTKRVAAATGGLIVAGRHSVLIPRNALAVDTDIWVIDKTGSKGVVEVQLYPEGLHFAKPVMLSTIVWDLKDPGVLTWYWWNPTTGLWEPIGGQVTIDGLGVFTWLEHFSTYRPGMMTGKAGW